jgi:excisionase family DNA binding protein
MQTNEFLTAKEAAQRIRTSEAQVWQWIREGKLLPPVVAKIGKKILVNSHELNSWLRDGGTIQKENSTRV